MRPKLDIRETEKPWPGYGQTWLFLRHKEPYSNFDLRWLIAKRQDGWIGVLCSFPATHKRAVDRIANEMELAKQAIQIIEGKALPKLLKQESTK